MQVRALLPLLITSTALAQAAPQAATTLRLSSNLVLVPAQVQTRHGDMLYGLKPSQFILQDNGVPQTIKIDEDTDSQGLSLVVVVQCSRDAYAQFNRLRGLTAMVDDLTGGAPRQVAVVSYGNEPDFIAPEHAPAFTSDPDQIARNLAELQPCEDGGAATLDAVSYSNHLFDTDPATATSKNRRAILLISETRDHGSHRKPEAVVAELGRSNTVVDSVSFSPGKTFALETLKPGGPTLLDPIALFSMAVNALRKNIPHTLSSLTGGEYTNFTTQKGFDAGVHRLANHIHNFYLISFQPPAANPTGLHRITVRIPDYPDAHIRSRLTYYAGEAPPPDVPEP